MVLKKNIKFTGIQKYLSKKSVKLIDSKKFYPSEPFYIVLDRTLGLTGGKHNVKPRKQ